MTPVRRALLWIGISLAGILVLALAAGGILYAVVTAPSPTYPADGSATAGTWYQHDLGDEAMAADGSDYRLYVKPGAGENLVVFFGGGGVTWDAASAAQPISVGGYLFGDDPGNYFRSIPNYFPRTLGGMLDATHDDNPFADWDMVVIPYATGDFHTGATLAELDGTTMHYNGQRNVELALTWISEWMPDPDTLLVAGGSAGGFGATFWTPTFADAYPDATVYSFSEGNQLPYDSWPTVANDLWRADWESTFGYPPGANLYETAVLANREALGDDVVFLDSNTTADGVLIAFEGKISGSGPDATAWAEGMRASMSRLHEAVPNYFVYVTSAGATADGLTPHTLSSLPEYYTTVQDGVGFRDWLADAVIHDRPYDVGLELLR
jgi:hypothetical protein